MKAFDEWYTKYAREHPWRDNPTFIKDAWKAALEFAKREAIPLDERGDISRNILNREIKEST